MKREWRKRACTKTKSEDNGSREYWNKKLNRQKCFASWRKPCRGVDTIVDAGKTCCTLIDISEERRIEVTKEERGGTRMNANRGTSWSQRYHGISFIRKLWCRSFSVNSGRLLATPPRIFIICLEERIIRVYGSIPVNVNLIVKIWWKFWHCFRRDILSAYSAYALYKRSPCVLYRDIKIQIKIYRIVLNFCITFSHTCHGRRDT